VCLSSDQKHGKAAPFKNTGFPHYDRMSDIMPKIVKRTHAFRASQQSRGAVSNTPASLSKGKEMEKGKGKGKEMGKGKRKGKKRKSRSRRSILIWNFMMTTTTTKTTNQPPSFLHPGLLLPSLLHLSLPLSLSAPSSSKHKYSALDDDSMLTSSRNSSGKKQKPRSGAAVIDGVEDGLQTIGNSIRDMTAERKLHQLQQEAHADAQAAQAARQLQVSSSPQRRHEAMQRLQQTETYLDPDHMIALVDLVSSNTIAANVYMTLEQEDYRQAWVSKRLKELGFVEGIIVNEYSHPPVFDTPLVLDTLSELPFQAQNTLFLSKQLSHLVHTLTVM
jgi:hypothetical protein